MPDDDIKAELERLAEHDHLVRSGRATSLTVSETGDISLYGLGRVPIKLHKEEWVKLLDMADQIRAFIKDNEGKTKSEE